MSFWSALVAIVAILAFTAARIARYRAGLGDPPRRDRAGHMPSLRENELRNEVEDLRKRIAVLERLATDDSRSKAIAEEIENLR